MSKLESRVYEGADIIDSRDVIERIEELESDEDSLEEEEREELKNLRALAEEAEGYAPDWKYGTALIHEGYFTKYAEQLADDMGAVDRNASWPLTHIDWDAAAEELKQDYTEVTYGSTAYLVR